MMLAESFADNINWTLFAAVLCALGTVGMWWDNRHAKPTKLPQPFRTQEEAPPATVKELQDAKLEHGRRLDTLEKNQVELWTVMRNENTAIRRENTEKFEAISRALGRIEGKLDSRE